MCIMFSFASYVLLVIVQLSLILGPGFQSEKYDIQLSFNINALAGIVYCLLRWESRRILE